jgi:hypothetical protein
MQEVAQPLARGYQLLTGGDRARRQEGWLRKIWTSLTGLGKRASIFHRAATASLSTIAARPAGSSGGGIFGLLSGALIGLVGLIGSLLNQVLYQDQVRVLAGFQLSQLAQ